MHKFFPQLLLKIYSNISTLDFFTFNILDKLDFYLANSLETVSFFFLAHPFPVKDNWVKLDQSTMWIKHLLILQNYIHTNNVLSQLIISKRVNIVRTVSHIHALKYITKCISISWRCQNWLNVSTLPKRVTLYYWGYLCIFLRRIYTNYIKESQFFANFKAGLFFVLIFS